MIFTVLLFIAAFSLEAIGTFISVAGLAALFASSPIIMSLAVCLDFGKLMAVSFLYRHWSNINLVMKSYMTAAAVVLMIITSAGCFSYLSGEFQKAISTSTADTLVINTLTEEKGRLQKRKEEIDKQIAQLPDTSVRGRTQLLRQFGPEVNRINERLVEIDKELPALQVASIKKNVEIGSIVYLAEAFDSTPEKAVKWVIFVIIFVFDPLAISLLLAGNYLLAKKPWLQKDAVLPAPVVEVEPPPAPAEEPVVEPAALAPPAEPAIEMTPAEPPVAEEPVAVEEPVVVVEEPAAVVVEEPAAVVEEPQVADESAVVDEVREQVVEEQVTAEVVAAPETPEVIEEQAPEVTGREVITLEQIAGTKPPRSALEDVDIRTGADVQMDNVDDNQPSRTLRAVYNGDTNPTIA